MKSKENKSQHWIPSQMRHESSRSAHFYFVLFSFSFSTSAVRHGHVRLDLTYPPADQLTGTCETLDFFLGWSCDVETLEATDNFPTK